MTFELTTISTQQFLRFTLLSIPFILFLSLGLAILTSTFWLVFLVIPLFAIAIIVAHVVSATETIILLEPAFIKINDREIPYQDIIGYFMNDTAMTQITLSLKLHTGHPVHITGLNFGDKSRKFLKVQSKVIRHLKTANPSVKELAYDDIYTRQLNILRPILIVLAGCVIVLDMLAVLALLTHQVDLPWQAFFANILLLALWPFLKKKKTDLT